MWETEDPTRHACARPRTPEGPARLLGRGQTFLWAILTPFNSSLKFANGCERPSAGEVGHRQPFSRTRTELGFNFGAVGFPEGSRPHKAICRWRLQANGGKAVLCSPHGRHPPPEGSPAPCGGQGALPHLCPCPPETPPLSSSENSSAAGAPALGAEPRLYLRRGGVHRRPGQPIGCVPRRPDPSGTQPAAPGPAQAERPEGAVCKPPRCFSVDEKPPAVLK